MLGAPRGRRAWASCSRSAASAACTGSSATNSTSSPRVLTSRPPVAATTSALTVSKRSTRRAELARPPAAGQPGEPDQVGEAHGELAAVAAASSGRRPRRGPRPPRRPAGGATRTPAAAPGRAAGRPPGRTGASSSRAWTPVGRVDVAALDQLPAERVDLPVGQPGGGLAEAARDVDGGRAQSSSAAVDQRPSARRASMSASVNARAVADVGETHRRARAVAPASSDTRRRPPGRRSSRREAAPGAPRRARAAPRGSSRRHGRGRRSVDGAVVMPRQGAARAGAGPPATTLVVLLVQPVDLALDLLDVRHVVMTSALVAGGLDDSRP